MSRIAIVTDSVASIPEALLESLHIHVVPYYLHRGQEVLRDLVDIHRDAFYQWMLTAQELPQTANPGPGDYINMYETLAQQEGVDAIVSIHITSKGSGAYQAAMVAKEMLSQTLPRLRIEVIDSLNVSMCQGWMVIEAARAALAGNSLADVIGTVRNIMSTARMIQTADTLKYLFMGGRIGKARHLVGSLLNLRPLIGIEDGIVVPLGVARTRQRAYEMIIEMVEKAVGPGGKVKMAYVHAAACEEAEKLRALAHARLSVVEELFAELSPVLGVHSGPGTVGVCYYPVD